MENVETSGTDTAIDNEKAKELLSQFDPSYDEGVGNFSSPQDEVTLKGMVENPDAIDALTELDAKNLCDELNAAYGFNYMLPNSTHNRFGVQDAGVEGGQFTNKAMLKQFVQDTQWINAANQGVGEMQNILNKGYAAKLGITGEAYGSLTVPEKAKKILDAKAVPSADKLSAEFSTWMNSWDVTTKNMYTEVPSGRYTLGEVGAMGIPSVSPIMKKVLTKDAAKASRGITDYDDSEVVALDDRARRVKAEGGVVTSGGKQYRLVTTDEKGERLVDPYFAAEDGSTLKGIVEGRNDGLREYYKMSQYDEKNAVHFNAVRQAMSKTGDNTVQDFARRVWMSDGRIFNSDGDAFYASRVGDRFELSVIDGGNTEKCLRVVGMFEDQFDNERNAMNAIVAREILASNPAVLKWYEKFKATQDDNMLGSLDRRGDCSVVLDEFMAEFAPYAKEDSELTEEGKAKKQEYLKTFEQLIDVLKLTDMREGFDYSDNIVRNIFAGIGNAVLDFGNSFSKTLRDAGHFYFDGWKDGTYYDQFRNWAEDDLRSVTETTTYDQGTLTGIVGTEAASLLAFSGVMKVGRIANLANALKGAGKVANAAGRGMKLAGATQKGQAVKSFGQRLVDAGRKLGGGTKTVGKGEAYGYRLVKEGEKLPKGAKAVVLDGKNYVRDIQKVPVGNYMFEKNAAQVAKFEKNVKELQDKLAQKKALAAGQMGQIAADDEAFLKVYDDIAQIEKSLAEPLGRLEYGRVSQWCLDLANELPSLAIMFGSTVAAHKAQSAYSIGEGFVERDKDGNVKKVDFNQSPLDVAEQYAFYDAAGNTVFLMHVTKLMKAVLKGEAGSPRAQSAMRNWYNGVMDAVSKGEYNRASALVGLYENAPRRLLAQSLHGGATVGAMHGTSAIIGNAENVALRRLNDPSYKPTVEDYMLSGEQALDVVKSFMRGAGGMAATGAVGGTVRELMSGRFSKNWKMITSMKQFSDATMDMWARAAAIGHAKGREVIDAKRLGTNLDASVAQVERMLMMNSDMYNTVRDDTAKFITEAIKNEIGTGDSIGSKELRNQMVAKYGERYARIMDDVMDFVRTDPAARAQFVGIYTADAAVKRNGGNRAFDEYGIKEVAKGIETLLGVKVRRPKMRSDGTFQLNIDTSRRDKDGKEVAKNGWLNLVFQSKNLNNVKLENGDFVKDWAYDVARILEGVELEGVDVNSDFYKAYSERYGEQMKKFAAMDEAKRKLVAKGKDVDGILSEMLPKLIEAQATAGVFSVNVELPVVGKDGKPVVDKDGNVKTAPQKVVTMNSEVGNLEIVDFAHETTHAIISQLRDSGYFKAKDGSDMEETLRQFYGGEGTEWEESFVKDLLVGRDAVLDLIAKKDAVAALDDGGPLAKLVSGMKRILKLPFAMREAKPVKSEVEKFIDAKVEEAKRAKEDEDIREAAEERVEELKSEIETGAETEGGALVVSTQPIPNSVMMKDVDDIPSKTKELNDSGFYYDSLTDMWVNKHSAPTLYHRSVNEAIAKKVKSHNDRIKEAFDLFQKSQGEIAAAVKAEQDKGSTEDVIRQLRDRMVGERRNRIRELVSPEDFTQSEREKMGIVVDASGEPLGVVTADYDFINDGKNFYSYKDLPEGAEIVPYDHDLHGRWAVRGMKAALADHKMIAVHNLSPRSAERFLRTGKTAGLSVAVLPEGVTHNGFGLVSLVFGKKSIDPKAKDANGNNPNFLFDIDYGTPVWGDIYTDGTTRNIMQQPNEEWAVAEGRKYETPEEVGQGFFEFMDYEHNQYPSWNSKKHRMATVEKLRKQIVVGKDGTLSLPNIYGEDKLARMVEAGEVIGITMPRVTDEMRNSKNAELQVVDTDAVTALAAKMGHPERAADLEAAVRGIIEAGQFIPDEYKNLVKTVKGNEASEVIHQLDEIARIAELMGIPVEYWDAKKLEIDAEHIGPRTDAIKRLQDRVPDMRFGVVGMKGAYRYFGDANNDVLANVGEIIREAIAAVDEGTRTGLKSSKNAELNKWLEKSGKNRFGPFILHIGGTDGDLKPRLEFAEKKPKLPQAFLDRAKSGEQFRLYDILPNSTKYAKAYPDLIDTKIYFTGTKAAKDANVQIPSFGGDNTFIVANENNEIVVNTEKWNTRLAPEQFAQAIVGMVQKDEGWQERIRQSDKRLTEALSPTRAKRQGSDMAFRLVDDRFLRGDTVGVIVEKAVRNRLGKTVDEKMLKGIAETIADVVRNSVRDFAGEAEARFLGSRFGLPEEKLRDYSAAERVFKDTLVAFDSGLVSAQQTKKNLTYWEDVILRAVDTVLFGKKARNADRPTQTLLPQFREAIADEVMEAIVNHIANGSRAARTDTEARLAGVLGRGFRGRGSTSEASVGYAEGQRTEIVDGEEAVNRIDEGANENLAGLSTVGEGDIGMSRTIDMKWENAKNAVVAEIRDELAKIREVVKKDASRAGAAQKSLMDKINKLVADNSSTDDAVRQREMASEAIALASQNSRWRVVGMRRTPKTLLAQATAAKLAKARLTGKGEDKVRSWLEDSVRKIGVPEADVARYAFEVMNDATGIADAIVRNSKPSQSDAELMRKAEQATAMNELSKRVINGFRGGYNVGAGGTDAEYRARSEARRILTKMAKDIRGVKMAELNSMLGGDIIGDIVNMRERYGSGDALALDFIKKFSEYMMANDPQFQHMSKEEFENSPSARNALALTVSSWLRETARQLGYGQTREWAMKEAARLSEAPNRSVRDTFAALHMTIERQADRLASAIDGANVDNLLDGIDKQIDKYAGGNDAVAQSIPDYKRKIAPRLAEYWKYVKKVMRMTDEAVDKEVRALNATLNMSDKQLLDLGAKGSDDVAAAESGLEAREDAMMKLSALLRFGGMAYKTFGECESIFSSQMAAELAGQMQRHLVMRNARLADDARIRQAFIGELTAIRNSKRGEFDKPDNGTKAGNFLAFSVADLFRRMQLYLHEGTEAWNYIDQFRQDMSLGHIDRAVFVSQWEGEMRKAAKEIFGVNFERLVEDWMVKRPEYDKFSRTSWFIPENAAEKEVFVNGKKRKVRLATPNDGSAPTNLPTHLSKANLLYIYAACQQADMQVNNIVYGRDAKYLREIEDIIGPEGVKMAAWLTEAYSKMRERIDPISREISGMSVLSPDERYCPLSFIQDQVSNDERRFTSSPFPSFLTRRVTHDSLRLNEGCDAFRMFEDKIQDTGHYIGFAKIIDRMNSTLKHPKVQTAFAQLYGTKAKNDIYAQLADALNGGRKNADTLLNGARNFVTATSLLGNIGSALKQLEGIGGWSVEMGLMPWLKGLVRNPMTSAEVREGLREIIDAGLFLTRSEEGISEAMVSLMNSMDGVPLGAASKTYNWYKKHGMDLTKFIDKIASMSMAAQYYTGRRNWYIENGLKTEDAKRRALADTDYAIQTTQQSGRSEFLHSAQRGGMAGKMLTQFSGPSFVRWGIECASWHRAVVMGDRGAWGKLASRLIALHLICPAILSLAGGISGLLFRRDDQEEEEIIQQTEKDIIVNCLTGPMSGWFIYGQIINAFAYQSVMPDVKTPQSKVHFEAPVLSKLHSLQQMTGKMYKDIMEAAPWDRFDTFERRQIAEDALRIFELLAPASRVVEPVKRMVK